MTVVAPPPKTLIVGVTVVISLLLLFRLIATTSYVPSFAKHVSPAPAAIHHDSENPVRNKTLGFEKVISLNLPERSDKRDGLSLGASLTNISITYVDGVKGQDVSEKAYPYGPAAEKFTKPMLGSWRAHLNAIRTVVEEGYSSALILEDDVDWDIRIKDQLVQFAEGARWGQGYDEGDHSHSPYGDNWDLMWLGHCHGQFDTSLTKPYVFHDPTTVEREQLKVNPKMRDWLKENWPDHSRVVSASTGGGFICTYAYAITHRGAEKLLYDLSVKHLTALFDNAVDLFCKHYAGSRCIGVYPSYFWPHEARGGKGKNSDNRPDINGITESVTKNIQWPVRMNIADLLDGKTEFPDSWPDIPEAEKQPAPEAAVEVKKAPEEPKVGDNRRRSLSERRRAVR